MGPRPVNFAVIGADHIHSYMMAEDMAASGGIFKGWWTRGTPVPAGAVVGGTVQPLPESLRVKDYRTLLDDPTIELVLITSMPNERAKLAAEAIRAGKDVVADKPAVTTLEDLNDVRKACAETGRFWSVNYSERYWVRAVLRAVELAQQGVIGKVIHTVGLGPHRGKLAGRPAWFFDPKTSGGVLNDLASHQIDHFLIFTGSKQPRVVTSSVGNFTRPDRPAFEDFGEVLLHGENASGYARVDWLTPDAQPYASDSRLTVLGTEGVIEIRKYVDLGGVAGRDHLLVVHGDKFERVDCSKVPLTYFSNVARDVRERSATAEPAGHSLLVSELVLQAQAAATRLGHLAR